MRELVARCEALSDLPRRFGLVPGHESSGLRRLEHQGYLILYTIESDRVSVVRIIHGAMDYERVLFPVKIERPIWTDCAIAWPTMY